MTAKGTWVQAHRYVCMIYVYIKKYFTNLVSKNGTSDFLNHSNSV